MSHILLVDHFSTFRQDIAEVLEARGYTVLQAESAVAGFITLQRYRADLIVVHLGILGFEGIHFIGWVRRIPRLAQLPVIALSGFRDPSLSQPALPVGVNRYLRQPFSIDQLLDYIQDLPLMQGAACLAEQRTVVPKNEGSLPVRNEPLN